jgi:hypothetical protein
VYPEENVPMFELLLKQILTSNVKMDLICRGCSKRVNTFSMHPCFAIEDLDRNGILMVGYDGVSAVPNLETKYPYISFSTDFDYTQGFMLDYDAKLNVEIYSVEEPDSYSIKAYEDWRCEEKEAVYEEKSSFGYAGVARDPHAARKKAMQRYELDHNGDEGLYCRTTTCRAYLGAFFGYHDSPLFLLRNKVEWKIDSPNYNFVIKAELYRCNDDTKTPPNEKEMENTTIAKYLPRY